MEQTERISLMEQRLRRATEAARALDAALDLYEAARPDVERLEQYYGSPEWWQDLADDQAADCPTDCPAACSPRTPSGISWPNGASCAAA